MCTSWESLWNYHVREYVSLISDNALVCCLHFILYYSLSMGWYFSWIEWLIFWMVGTLTLWSWIISLSRDTNPLRSTALRKRICNIRLTLIPSKNGLIFAMQSIRGISRLQLKESISCIPKSVEFFPLILNFSVLAFYIYIAMITFRIAHCAFRLVMKIIVKTSVFNMSISDWVFFSVLIFAHWWCSRLAFRVDVASRDEPSSAFFTLKTPAYWINSKLRSISRWWHLRSISICYHLSSASSAL